MRYRNGQKLFTKQFVKHYNRVTCGVLWENKRKELLTQEARESCNSSYTPQRTENRDSDGDLYMNRQSSSLTIANKQKPLKCPSVDKQTHKRWYIHAMDYHWAIKKNEIPILPTTWMNLGNITEYTWSTHACTHAHAHAHLGNASERRWHQTYLKTVTGCFPDSG